MKHSFSVAAAAGLVVCGVSLLPAPALAQNREHQQMTAELRIVQEQQQQIALSLAQLAEALKALNTRIDETSAASRKSFADQELTIKNLSGDISAIRERTQDTDTRIRTLGDEIDAQRASIAALPSILAQQFPAGGVAPGPVDPNAPAGAAPSPAPPVSAAPAPAAPPPPSSVGLSPTRMLDTAKVDYYSQRWALAISGFEAVMKAFPRSESAGEAQFYIGETHFAQNKWPDAITAYTAVIQNYRTAGIVPDAYYKLGRAQDAAGQLDNAKASWEQLIKSFPDSQAAQLARQGLDRLTRRAQP
jgi:tol-pal system protein YbgF